MESQILKGLNQAQREAVVNYDSPSLIIAGAGSGKTRVLTSRIAYMIEQGVAPYNILALTFTNKAAEQMRERIAQMLPDGRHRYIRMGTFHSVFSRILRENADRIGFPESFTIYEPSDCKNLLKDKAKARELWTPAARSWFPKGVDDPHLSLTDVQWVLGHAQSLYPQLARPRVGDPLRILLQSLWIIVRRPKPIPLRWPASWQRLWQWGTQALGAFHALARTEGILAGVSSGAALAKDKTPSAIVVGGGLAGLTAAYELQNKGWQVTLLEAKSGMGGRSGLATSEWIGNDKTQPVLNKYVSTFKLSTTPAPEFVRTPGYLIDGVYYTAADLATKDPTTAEALKRYASELKDDIDYYIYVQYLFFKQWEALRAYAHAKGVKIPGLYAVGTDAGGLYGDTYDLLLGGSTAGFAANTGRIAAENALIYAGIAKAKK